MTQGLAYRQIRAIVGGDRRLVVGRSLGPGQVGYYAGWTRGEARAEVQAGSWEGLIAAVRREVRRA